MKKYIFLILAVVFTSTTLISQSTIDSLETRLINSKEGEKAEILAGLVFEYRDINPPKAIEYGQQILKQLNDLKDEIRKAVFFNDLGWAHYNLQQNKIALEYANRSLDIGKKLSVPRLQSNALNSIGAIYWSQNDYVKALEHYLLAVELQEKTDDRYNLANSYNNIGIIFYSTKDYEKSLKYLLKALELYEELDEKTNITYTKLNMTGVYSNLNNHEKALEYGLSSLKYSEEIGDERLSGIILLNLAIMYYTNFNDKNKALEYLNRSLIITKKYDDKGNIIKAYLYLGSIYKDMGNYKIALEKENEALKIAREVNDNMQIMNILEEMSSIYAK